MKRILNSNAEKHNHNDIHSHNHSDSKIIKPESACSGDSCCCSGNQEIIEEKHEELTSKSFLTGVALFAMAVILENFVTLSLEYTEQLLTVIYLVAYFLIGREVLETAVKNVLKREFFDENFLMVIASMGAFAISEHPEAVAVMLFYQVGEYMQGRAVSKSKKSISQLLDIRADTANLVIDEKLQKVDANSLKIGDVIAVKAGEKVPVDSIVISGNSTFDTKALTGESMPLEVTIGSKILSGFVNGEGMIYAEVLKTFEDSTASKIIEMVENASGRKAKTEQFITKFAKYYTPFVVLVAVALATIPPYVLGLGTFSEWLYRALVFLVISCPCALVISIPLGFFGGIGAASTRGILVKSGNYLEALNSVDTIIFDKTGTLTTGVFQVAEIINANGFSKEDVLKYGAYAEHYSNHPISLSIKNKYNETFTEEVDEKEIKNLIEKAGYGIEAIVYDKKVIAGNKKLMDVSGIDTNTLLKEEPAGTIVYLGIDGKLAGLIIIEDTIREDSKNIVEELRKIGITKLVMLTGDNKRVANKVGNELEIKSIYSELLPGGKLEAIEKIIEDNNDGKVLFMGDGINDAPVLARADVGIAMGGIGADAAIEAADIVIMNDEPSKIITAIKIARKTRKIVWQNIFGALSVKAVVLALGALGIATMWSAVFADVGVALLAVLNSVRAGRI